MMIMCEEYFTCLMPYLKNFLMTILTLMINLYYYPLNAFPLGRCNQLSRFQIPYKPVGSICQADSCPLMIAFMELLSLGIGITRFVASFLVIFFVSAIIITRRSVCTYSNDSSNVAKGTVIVSIARTGNGCFVLITSYVSDLRVIT